MRVTIQQRYLVSWVPGLRSFERLWTCVCNSSTGKQDLPFEHDHVLWIPILIKSEERVDTLDRNRRIARYSWTMKLPLAFKEDDDDGVWVRRRRAVLDVCIGWLLAPIRLHIWYVEQSMLSQSGGTYLLTREELPTTMKAQGYDGWGVRVNLVLHDGNMQREVKFVHILGRKSMFPILRKAAVVWSTCYSWRECGFHQTWCFSVRDTYNTLDLDVIDIIRVVTLFITYKMTTIWKGW